MRVIATSSSAWNAFISFNTPYMKKLSKNLVIDFVISRKIFMHLAYVITVLSVSWSVCSKLNASFVLLNYHGGIKMCICIILKKKIKSNRSGVGLSNFGSIFTPKTVGISEHNIESYLWIGALGNCSFEKNAAIYNQC